jgi:UDP-N-acetylglucosamine 2-epimerase (non-hydrolysing)
LPRISFIFGTRPEAIKLCPLILATERYPGLEAHVCVTAQHRGMLDQVLDTFEVKADMDLDLMRPSQTLAKLTSRSVQAVDLYLQEAKPDLVVVQGDTTTVLSAALAAFYRNIPVAHVEAGLRTWRKDSPFPEEINRVLTTRLADLHFAPTDKSAENLRTEGVDEKTVFVTGNTVIDALLMSVDRARSEKPRVPGLPDRLLDADHPRLVLVTGHRRENFGEGVQSICRALAELAVRYPDTHFIYPVHLNPNVLEPVHQALDGLTNIHLIAPLSYLPFIRLMDASYLLLTDSGGVQEEAPSLGKPVLVMRDTTERPEAVEAGTVRLVGADQSAIINETARLLDDEQAYADMARAHNPYGDGQACGRILDACRDFLEG